MSKNQVKIEEQNSTTVKSIPGNISHVTETEDVMIRRPTNHNEISIMEDDLNRIKKKANKIKLEKVWNLPVLIAGASIPYGIDIFIDYANGKSPNYFGFFVCVVLIILTMVLSKKFPVLGTGNSAENRVYLEDIQEFFNKIDINN